MCIRILYGFVLSLMALTHVSDVFSQTLTISVIESTKAEQRDSVFKEEIRALFDGEIQIEFVSAPISARDSEHQAEVLLNKAFSDEKIDLILVLDIAANQVLGQQPAFTKPTFLPFVFNASLSGFPVSGESSGKKNLNYITFEFDFEDELRRLQSIASFRRATLVSNSRIEKSLAPEMLADVKRQAKNAGVDLNVTAFDGDSQKLLDSLPADTDVILYGYFANPQSKQAQSLIQRVTERGIVSFSLAGEEYVRLGALATNNPATDIEKLARRTALHIQEVILGQPASELPVVFDSSNQLLINMATSRRLRVAPPFDVLSDARLINELSERSNRIYSLAQVAKMAVDQNLSIVSQRLQAEIADKSVNEVRSALLPQIGASIEYTTRRDNTGSVRAGNLAKASTDGSLSLSQSLFSEELWAAYTIQKYSALSEKELLREIELDITRSAVNAYLNVLREKTSLEQERYNLTVISENYRLSKNRVDVGAETAADLYRWESELASAKQSVLLAKSSFEQQKQELNQILNRPIYEDFATTVERLDNPDLLISDRRITELIKNVYDLRALTDFFVEIGLQQAPEIKQAEATLAANRRQLKSDRRAYWLPDLNLTGEYIDNFDEERALGGIAAADHDWQIGIEISLPIYEGGARGSRTAQSRLAVQQSEANILNAKNEIEQNIRNNLEATHASYNSIPLAKKSEEAAQRNFELIVSSYAQGAKNITEVLDAQETLIDAREASMNAVYAFLIDLMNVQRAIGTYDFFLTNKQRIEFSDDLISRVSNAQ